MQLDLFAKLCDDLMAYKACCPNEEISTSLLTLHKDAAPSYRICQNLYTHELYPNLIPSPISSRHQQILRNPDINASGIGEGSPQQNMSQNDEYTSPNTLSNDSTESEWEDTEDFSSNDDSTPLNVSQEKTLLTLEVLLNDSVEAVWEDVEDSGTNEGLSQDRQYPSPGTSLTETTLLKLEDLCYVSRSSTGMKGFAVSARVSRSTRNVQFAIQAKYQVSPGAREFHASLFGSSRAMLSNIAHSRDKLFEPLSWPGPRNAHQS
jgi:hypothetical protein